MKSGNLREFPNSMAGHPLDRVIAPHIALISGGDGMHDGGLCAGFKGIWGSGLSISAQLGVRDSNEASWTQVGIEVISLFESLNSIV